MDRAWLAVDIGTHAVRAASVNAEGMLGRVFLENVGLRRLDERRVEQDPLEILGALRRVIDRALHENIAWQGVGLACQRSTVVAWRRRNGEALGAALSWQDTRGFAQVERLTQHEPMVLAHSGLVLSPHYGASKLRWLQEQYSGVADLCLSPLVSYLLHHLLREAPIVCDESNAGRTQLWNLRQRHWDQGLLELFGVDGAYLPSVSPTLTAFGRLRCGDLPLQAVTGDQNAALVGCLELLDGDAVLANLGSGAFVLGLATGETPPPERLLEGLAFSDKKVCQRIHEGTVNGAGLALSWFASQPEVSARGGETWLFSQLPSWLEREDCCGTVFRNTIGGLGSPFWRVGSSPSFSPENSDLPARAVAVVESIVFLISLNLWPLLWTQLNARTQPKVRRIRVTGGLARLGGLCQRLADLQQLPVERLVQTEATLVGCARLASGFEIPLPGGVEQVFQPRENRGLHERLTRFQDWLLQNNE